MSDERWERVIEMIKNSFHITEHEIKENPSEGIVKEECVCFEGLQGKLMKLERVWKPLVLGTKVIGSKRIGSNVSEEYIFSEDEYSTKVFFYQFDDQAQSWQELSVDTLTQL